MRNKQAYKTQTYNYTTNNYLYDLYRYSNNYIGYPLKQG